MHAVTHLESEVLQHRAIFNLNSFAVSIYCAAFLCSETRHDVSETSTTQQNINTIVHLFIVRLHLQVTFRWLSPSLAGTLEIPDQNKRLLLRLWLGSLGQ